MRQLFELYFLPGAIRCIFFVFEEEVGEVDGSSKDADFGPVRRFLKMSHVLIVFQANTEQTEQLALAVGVGAVESEAGIRLRRLRLPGAVEVGHKDYGTLREADLLWADTLVVGLEGERAGTEELDGLRVILKELDPTQMKGKRAWTFGADGIGKKDAGQTEAQRVVEESLLAAGIALLPSVVSDANDAMERMKDVGRQLGREQI
jgi:hypothetical protein